MSKVRIDHILAQLGIGEMTSIVYAFCQLIIPCKHYRLDSHLTMPPEN